MIARLAAALALCACTTGCSKGGAPAPAHEDPTKQTAHGEVAAPADPGAPGGDVASSGSDHESPAHAEGNGADSVHIEPSMLRDLRVTTQAAESRPAGESVTVLGELQVSEDAYAEVGSPVAARISKILVAAGDGVQAGQVLAELSSSEVGKARAELQASEARRNAARVVFERRRELAADQIVSERELQASRAELAQADAESAGARQLLSSLGAAAGMGPRFNLVSPVAGTVIDRSAVLGRVVDAEHTLFSIGDLRRLWLIVHAFERDALRMRTETAARVSFPALPGNTAVGRVARIGSRVDAASRTIAVRIEIENPSGQLRPGMSASALVTLGDSTETVVAVPVEALQRAPEGWCVFLPTDREGIFTIRPVGRGRDLGSEVEVLSGLRAGERVVKDGAFLLKAEAEKARGGGEDHHH
jgi:membrane fusion protein, heavy metal efflux system